MSNIHGHSHELFSLMNALNATLFGTERLLGGILADAGHLSLQDLTLLNVVNSGVRYPTEIARALGVASPSASQAIGRLIAAGLLERETDDSDGRKRRVTLTAAGMTALANATKHLDATLESGRYPRDPETLSRLRRQIAKFAKGMRVD